MKIPELSKQQWITVAVVAVVVIVLVIVAVRLAKRAKKRGNDRKKEQEYARQSQEIINAGGQPSQLTSSQIATVAKRINDAVNKWYLFIPGTDEKKLVNAIKSIPTAADYFLIKAEYVREYSIDMWDDITDDVSESFATYNQIDAHLNLIGVPVNMR